MSYILSVERYDDGGDFSEPPAFTEQELDEIGQQIRAGRPYVFDSAGVAMMEDKFAAFRSMTWKDLLSISLSLLGWLWPLWLIIVLTVMIVALI